MKRVVFFCFLGLAGCATNAEHLEDEPLAYRKGYRHGCGSGYVSAGASSYSFAKDVRRYAHNDSYDRGWDDGFDDCKGKYEAAINESEDDLFAPY
jgi:hypothetical protein